MNTLINSIYEAKEETRQELVELMSQEIEEKKNIVLGDLRRVFAMISMLLQDPIKGILLATHKLIIALLSHILPAESENGIKLIEQQLLRTLADTDGEVRKTAKAVFVAFVQRTRNTEQVLTLLSGAFASKNFYIRERAINLVPDVLLVDKSIFSSRSGINEVRRVIENIIIHSNDVNASVREASIKTLRKIKYIEKFDLVYRRLASDHQSMMDKIQREVPIKVDKFIQLNLGCLKDEQHIDKIAIDTSPFDILSKQCYDVADFPQDLKSKLYFGFLREDILKDTLNQNDLTIREQGILQLNQQFFSDFEEEMSINSEVILKIVDGGFMPSFFKYISSLFTCQDYKVVNVLLSIISKIMQVPGVHVNAYLPLCLQGLIRCLSDDRVVIRQRALFLLRQLTKYFRRKQYFQNIVYFLDQPCENWHIKEELLNLLSYIVLQIEPHEEWFYEVDPKPTEINQNTVQPRQQVFNMQGIDFTRVLKRVAYFLDDPIAKVKFASLECLAVFSYLHRRHIEYLHELLDQKIYDTLMDKVDNGIVYFINQHGNLELPQINIQKYEKLKQSYVELQQQISELQSQQPVPEPELSEESVQSNYKVTYYYDKFPISMRDKIKLSNRSLDNLFAFEHNQIEATRYDVIVPIGQFKPTQGKETFIGMNSNIYMQSPQDDEVMVTSSEEEDEQLHSVEFQYPTRTMKYRGHPPESMSSSKFQSINDIKERVFRNMKELNEDINVDTQIPKVIKANVGAYQGYSYQGEPEDDDEIFVDTKAIQQEYKNAKQTNFDNPNEKSIHEQAIEQPIDLEYIKQQFKEQHTKFTPEQRYQKRLQEFLISFENRELQGKNARKIKRKLTQQAKIELPKILIFKSVLDDPIVETNALIVNLSTLDIRLLQTSLNKLKILLVKHIDQVYASQAPLLQIMNDVQRLLSTQNDNPLYAIDYSAYPQYDPQTIVRVIVHNAMQTLSVAAQALRSVLVNVGKMFRDVGIWLQDENLTIRSQAEQTLLDIIRHCDDRELEDILPKLYNKTQFHSKIYVGVLIENLVIKHRNQIASTPHFRAILHLISQMIIDVSFDVRRQGKKVFFKLLNYSSNDVDDAIQGMPLLEKEQMRSLTTKHRELLADDQIGEFDQEAYMNNQAMPERANIFEVEDFYHMIT